MRDDPLRLLHKNSQHGYTNQSVLALNHEPEAISHDDQAWLTYRAQRHQAEQRAAELDANAGHTLAQRLHNAQAQRATHRVDLTRELRLLEHHVARAEEQLRAQP